MEAVLILMLIGAFLSLLSFGLSTPKDIARDKMKRSILEIEKILNLSDTHIDIELDRMSDQDLTNLYQDLGEKFDHYIIERNAKNNKNALEDF